MGLPIVGTQLLVFSGKHKIEDDIEIILDTVADAGYAAVEGGPADAARYKPMLDARGLVYGGSHAGLQSLREDVPGLIKYLRTMDASDVCNSGLLKWDNLTAQDYYEAIPILNQIGKTLRSEGIWLHYHNHAFEFDKVEGDRTGMDLLMDGLDPDAVDFCIDVAWVQKGGEEPAAYIQKYQDIIGYLHFKDFDDEGWCELGRGKVGFEPIMKVLPTMPFVRWVMIEQDSTRNDPHDSSRISRQFLKDRFNY
jgi:sugar phosphate isomerase/epimerase